MSQCVTAYEFTGQHPCEARGDEVAADLPDRLPTRSLEYLGRLLARDVGEPTLTTSGRSQIATTTGALAASGGSDAGFSGPRPRATR